jgi:ribosomal protein S27AE
MLSANPTIKCRHCHSYGKAFDPGLKTCISCREKKAAYRRSAAGRASENKSKKKWRMTAKGREQTIARAMVGSAVHRGKLKREPCEKCGEGKVEAHHDSYLKENWLKVRWLCLAHHKEHHNAVG